MKSDELIEELLKTRMLEWSRPGRRADATPGPVVAISREPGCGGEAIAERLATELNLHLYSWEIVERIAKDTHVSAEVVATLDEKTRSELKDWLSAFHGDRTLSSYAYLESLKKVIFAIAAHGNAVILGRCSNFLIPSGRRIGLCLVAPFDLRIGHVMEEGGVSEEQARAYIAKLEAEHRLLIQEYFHADILDPSHYHLVINTALVEPGTIVQIVKKIIGMRAASSRPVALP
jgi:cytidylate kinase